MGEVVPISKQLYEIQDATNDVRGRLRGLTVPQRCEVLAALLASAICEAGDRPNAPDSAMAITRIQVRMIEAFKQLFPQEVPFV